MATSVTLPRDFYDRPTLDVARDLLGKLLVHQTPSGRVSGLIVEVEAYIGESDPACHAAPGRTRRNAPLYGPPGIAYVYLNYGMHYLVNAVTEPVDAPAAVLIRALEPREGVALMQRRRARGTGRPAASLEIGGLCRGPGNLTRALGIALTRNGADLCGRRLFIEDPGVHAATVGQGAPPIESGDVAVRQAGDGPVVRSNGTPRIAWGPRIGIRVGTDRPWRAWFDGHPCVSGRVVRTV